MPAEVVEQGPGPVRSAGLRLRELEATLRPLEHLVLVRDRDHVGGVAGEEELAQLAGARKRGLEQRNGRCTVTTRPEPPAALELDPDACNPVARERLCLLQQ